jgi:hypothetical protein
MVCSSETGRSGLYNEAQQEGWREIVEFIHHRWMAATGVPPGPRTARTAPNSWGKALTGHSPRPGGRVRFPPAGAALRTPLPPYSKTYPLRNRRAGEVTLVAAPSVNLRKAPWFSRLWYASESTWPSGSSTTTTEPTLPPLRSRPN